MSAFLLSPSTFASPRRSVFPKSQSTVSYPSISTPVCNATSPDIPGPLHDIRVLVTAPRPYAARLLAPLATAQCRPVHMPCISTTPLLPGDRDQLDNAILRLSDYSLVAFTSRVAISSFSSALRAVVSDDAAAAQLALKASGITIAALGADAQAVRDQLHVLPDIIPVTATPDALADLLAADPTWHGKSILCPVPRVTGMAEPPVIPNFLSALKEAGCLPYAVPAYDTSIVPREKLAPELAWMNDGLVEAVVISSTGEAQALRGLLTEEELDLFVEEVKAKRIVLAAHGPVTAEGICDVFGDLEVVVSDHFSTFQGVVDALEEEFAKRQRESGELVLPV